MQRKNVNPVGWGHTAPVANLMQALLCGPVTPPEGLRQSASRRLVRSYEYAKLRKFCGIIELSPGDYMKRRCLLWVYV